MREVLCLSVRKKSFTGKLFKLTYSELFFSAEKHAGNQTILTAAQRAESLLIDMILSPFTDNLNLFKNFLWLWKLEENLIS